MPAASSSPPSLFAALPAQLRPLHPADWLLLDRLPRMRWPAFADDPRLPELRALARRGLVRVEIERLPDGERMARAWRTTP